MTKGPTFVIRIIDIILSVVGLLILSPLLLVIVIIGFFDTGSPIFKQTRVGRHKKKFTLLKFRTMSVEAPSVASHLVQSSLITPFGAFLRKTKLDEVPQLINVLQGNMSIVGPRPCLFNQEELISERDQLAVFDYRPGITGLGQIKGVDMSTPKKLAEIDARMLSSLNVRTYFKYITFTLLGKGQGDRVISD
ncbi:sugar transferase [Kangiella sediminilitoris]|uniref:Putative colanic biosynthesis UDP-glucose lipid carrier transferase n=1 Tax=Kangiella sediminilitoris TaxID=1144748 RepID=A0A1B3BBH8_9GAMM|nr:sugar transferase [Kangiella sediminilitoris]AOE50143.1 Putative colanic biosynthesis UDP-glucose lipid carrier transferase [Kangiella sediminilitoris]